MARSIESGETKFVRATAYDEALRALFPELEKQLVSDFGRFEV